MTWLARLNRILGPLTGRVLVRHVDVATGRTVRWSVLPARRFLMDR